MQKTKEFFVLLKRGNIPSLTAAIVNLLISIIKGVAFFFTGSVAMFAEMMHSIGDAANQFFVFLGSALSKKEPTEMFPNGFGRLVNLVCLGAVIVVGYLSIQTILHGFHQIIHPVPGEGFLINMGVLLFAVLMESYVLYQACQHILHEANIPLKGFVQNFINGFRHLKQASPATRLVFMEDLVATSGGVVAMIGIVLGQTLHFYQAEGIASVMIGCAMVYVVAKVFLENAAGALGVADTVMEETITQLVAKVAGVKDVQEVVVVKEGESIHVDVKIEVDPSISFAKADDIRDAVEKTITSIPQVTDITIELDEDDGVATFVDETK